VVDAKEKKDTQEVEGVDSMVKGFGFLILSEARKIL